MRRRAAFERHPCLWIFGFALLVYLATASYEVQSIDVLAAEEPAWALANHHTWDLSELPHRDIRWYFDQDGDVYSDRFPGSILYLVPAYWIAGVLGQESFSVVPGILSAAFVAAASVALMHRVFTAVLPRTHAFPATVFFGFGTGTWSIAANAPWSHSFDQLLITAALLALALGRTVPAAALAALMIPVRPVVGAASVALGVALALYRRSFRHAVGFSALLTCGALSLVAYNAVMFDRWSLSNGRELGGEIRFRPGDLPANIVGALFSPDRGALIYYPILVTVPLVLSRAWRQAFDWEKAAALAAVAGMLTQFSLNRYSGGDAFFGPRLLIEPLTLAAPLLARAVMLAGKQRPTLVGLLLFAGIGIHLFGALLM